MTEKTDLYDELVAKSKSALTERLTKEIAKLTKQIDKINKSDLFDGDDNNGNALLDINDRINILADMKEKFDLKQFNFRTKDIGSLFYHVDNIRYVYEEEGLKCPKWFSKKYSKKFVQ